LNAKTRWKLRITHGEKHQSNAMSRGSVFLHANFEELPDEMAMFKDHFGEEFPAHI
jgi:hypothetical protein